MIFRFVRAYQHILHMKTATSYTKRILIAAAISLPVLFSACSKDNDDENENSITAEEASEVMIQAVDPASGGLVIHTSVAVTVSLFNNSPLFCGVNRDSSINMQGSTNNTEYSFNLDWNRLLTCNGSEPSRFNFGFSGNSSYTGPNISSSDQSSGNFVITGLEPSSTQFTVNETYTRKGTQQLKVGNKKTVSSEIAITVNNLKVNKLTREIVSGDGTIRVNGINTASGKSFRHDGTLTFTGNRKAIVASAAGNYTVNW